MSNENIGIYIAFGTAAVALGLIPLRRRFAKAALQTTVRNVQPDVEKFKSDNRARFIASLTDLEKELVEDLVDLIQSAHEQRHIAVYESKTMTIPNAGSYISASSDTTNNIEAIQFKLKAVLANYFKQRTTRVIKAEAKRRMEDVAGHVTEHAPLNAVDGAIVDICDQFGIIDVAILSGELADNLIPEAVTAFTDSMSDLILFPGMIGSLKTAFKEYDRVSGGRATFEDSAEHVMKSVATTGGLMAAGMVLDAACLLPGVFTALGWFAGKFINHDRVKDELKENLDKLIPLLHEITERQRQGIQTIAGAIHTNLQDLPSLIATCPDFDNNKDYASFLEAMKAAYLRDRDWASQLVSVACTNQIARIPECNWWDKILGIDRKSVAANLYTTAAQEVTSALHAPAEYYVKNLQKSRLEGVQAIGNHPIIVGNETTLLLATLATKTPDWAINYHNQVALWKIKCATYYNEGSQKIPPVVTREQAGVETVKARNASSIAVYRGQVRLRLERLNQPTSLCP